MNEFPDDKSIKSTIWNGVQALSDIKKVFTPHLPNDHEVNGNPVSTLLQNVDDLFSSIPSHDASLNQGALWCQQVRSSIAQAKNLDKKMAKVEEDSTLEPGGISPQPFFCHGNSS